MLFGSRYHRPDMSRVMGLLLMGLACATAIAGGLLLTPTPPRTLVLDGYRYAIPTAAQQPFEQAIRQALELRSRQLLRQPTCIAAAEIIECAATSEWGGSIDTRGAQARAQRGLVAAHVGPRQSFGVYLLRRFGLRRESFAMTLPVRFRGERARALLTRLAQRVDRPAQNAQMLIDEHRIVPSRTGRRFSVEATIARMDATESANGWLAAVVTPLAPSITEDQLSPVDVTRVLASFETSFRGKAGARAVNIRVAGDYLNGAVILPGEVLSFNQTVGRRIHGRGFVDAPVIVNDELEKDVGGGVCQVATTLHAAAVYGNLEVVRRRSHSRPSGYAPLGLDATVIDGKVDLQIRNPYDEPLLVHVSYPGPYKIRVELLGREAQAEVEHGYSVTGVEPFARRIWHRPEVLPGSFEKKQKGRQGMDVVSVLHIAHQDGTVERRRYFSKYYPVPEVFWVSETGPGAQLPGLPEGASALVIDGQEAAVLDSEGGARPEEEVPSLGEADSSVL